MMVWSVRPRREIISLYCFKYSSIMEPPKMNEMMYLKEIEIVSFPGGGR